MTVDLPADPLYLLDGAEPVFGFFHSPATHAAAGGVLLCPPFGWDEICSYRSRRAWAQDLERAGFATMRIDLPGTGDSGGSPHDPGLVASWIAAVAAAARQLRRLSGLERVAAVGIGLGGLLTYAAIAEQAPIDELVLWGVPARGRVLLRELSVFASLEESAGPAEGSEESEPPPFPDGYLWAGGFLLSAATVGELERLDLTALELPAGRLRRALMLDRDGISIDGSLQSHLERTGVSVSVASGQGYGQMMAKPHHARAPRAVFDRVRQWLQEPDHSIGARDGRPAANASPQRRAPRRSTVELAWSEATVRETPIEMGQPSGKLFGILSQPAQAEPNELCVVMLNAGAIRRVGPNRMWVEAARRWAAAGIPALRLDLGGIGDADGDGERFSELAELYVPELVDQACAALGVLESRNIAQRFVLTGLCSGACWSFHAALRDERVAAAFMLNPKALFWDPSLEAARDLRRGLRSSSWRKVLRGEVPVERMMALAYRAPVALPRRALARRSARRRGESELDQALDRLRDSGKVLRFIFSGNEPLCEELERDGYMSQGERWPNVSFEFIPGQIHTLRPFQSQQRAHEALDRALADLLGRPAGQPLLQASP